MTKGALSFPRKYGSASTSFPRMAINSHRHSRLDRESSPGVQTLDSRFRRSAERVTTGMTAGEFKPSLESCRSEGLASGLFSGTWSAPASFVWFQYYHPLRLESQRFSSVQLLAVTVGLIWILLMYSNSPVSLFGVGKIDIFPSREKSSRGSAYPHRPTICQTIQNHREYIHQLLR